MPDRFWDDKANTVKHGDWLKETNELAAFKAAEDSRKLTLPQKPEDYPATLPADFRPPQGIEFKLDENDPTFNSARTFALKHGLSKDAWGELLALHAGARVGEITSIQTAKAAEVQKLGAAATARVTAVTTFLSAMLGEPDAKHFCSFMYTAQQWESVERLMDRFRTQGAGSYAPSREPGEVPGKISDADYDKLTYPEKRHYAATAGGRTQQANGARS